MGGDSREQWINSSSRGKQQLTGRPSSISHAAWPANLQRVVATDKAAQRRRAVIMQAWRWTRNNSAFAHLDTWSAWYKAFFLFMLQQAGAVLVTGGIILALYMLYQWSAWLLLVVIVAITCTITFRLLLDEPRIAHSEQPLVVSLDTQEPQTTREQPQAAPSFEFPDTPMPSTPLVRVLETIDLSSSDIEHFIRSTAEYTSEQKTLDLPLEEEAPPEEAP
jgi:hypothetical protein